MKYYYNLCFEVENMDLAEDVAAKLYAFDLGAAKRVRDSLWYDDPITGKPALWAEPVMTEEQLTARRADHDGTG